MRAEAGPGNDQSATLPELVEFGFEAVEGVFVLLTEFRSAFVEANLAGFFRFEEG
ncbi:MAG: hypothetical protein IT169_19090 [Bryobacterales bacterium]|nr:hypothetical protein [Bryobacterales bacterium]